MNKEPQRLRRGRQFHKRVQADWHANAEGEVETEKSVTKPSGRGGRMDVFVRADGKLLAVAEIKHSDWDAMSEKALKRNVRRQTKQVMDYVESQLAAGSEVSPGIIFPRRPKDPKRMRLIEQMFEEEGIPVAWEDETTEERRREVNRRR